MKAHQLVVIFNVKVTGSAEIVVTAGSTTDPQVNIANLLGFTIGNALKRMFARGYRLTFVTDKFFVCTKNLQCPVKHGNQRPTIVLHRENGLTLFHPRKSARKAG
ncbi:hypothetical protein [Alicyclobacillus dauci]|uniref:Uncharacterized protein n=1 Tax=Alicyclobacillus dauci TaxID=1475485 RepID=A0ABY6Z718_9BACL|nr:hypothetical protein [Alicyclobacillus dauci]WAH38473.1 hypothetical protein NZD86_08330 [Alicyclobacillus dauci]